MVNGKQRNVNRAGSRRSIIIALGILLGSWSCAFALDPTLDVGQYAHTAWKVSQGFSKGVIFSMAQTADGYFWIGTDSGLFRFDGVRTVQWRPPAGDQLASSDIRSLLSARDGRLWIGTVKGLASWREGKLTYYPQLDGLVVVTLLEDRVGTIWAGGWSLSTGKLCRIQREKTECIGEDGRFGTGVTALYEDSGGNLWAGAITGLWRWKPGPPRLFALPDPANGINGVIESDDGGILVTKDSGIIKLSNGKAEIFPLPTGLPFRPGKLFRDRDGALWIGAVVDSGVLHIHQGDTDLFTPPGGVYGDLSGGTVRSFLEDREGDIWVATADGVDRFRDYAVTTISIQQGLSGHSISSILAAKDGSMWLGESNGLNQWRNGKVTVYRKGSRTSLRVGSPVYALRAGMPAESRPVREIIDDGLPADSIDSLFEDSRGQIWVTTHSGVAILKSGRFSPVSSVPKGIVFSIGEDRTGAVWLSHQEGLFRLFAARVVERIPWAKLERGEPAVALRYDPSEGGLWLGFSDGEVVFFKEGQRAVTYALGESVGSFHIDARGTLWAATTRGLARIKGGRVLILTSDNGLPCNTVHWMMQGEADSIWLYTACGLVRMAQSELEAWALNPKSTIHPTVFDSVDGVRSLQFHYGRSPIVAKDAGSKLWFLPFSDVSVLDPHHLQESKLPPPVHIEQITADDKIYDATDGLRLAPHVRNLDIDYTALSLVVPEKVRFRVKLEGQDKDWRELVNVRHVEYTNLPPKHYRFRVLASNNSGVWNEEGAALDFVIPPMWYQTNWFRAACIAAFLAMLWAIYELRVRQLAAQFNMRLEERVSERTRIARELHDTLLQSFQAVLLRFQAGINMLRDRPVEASRVLEDAVDRASQAIAEGRDAIGGLRMSTVETNDLSAAIRTIAEELAKAHDNQASTPFQVLVEGTPRELHPILRDEVYRLATEALRNAFRHAAAKKVEVELRYDEKYFRLRVRDDGKGIDPQIVSGDGREGHYGLHGMRERAKVVGGKLTIWTELNNGTEIELTIPSARVYTKSARPFWYFGKHSATEADEKETIERE